MPEKRKCSGDCNRWRRCNYCRYSRMINGIDGHPVHLFDGVELPGFYCMNTEHPMCHDADGFKCIFRNTPANCRGRRGEQLKNNS